MKMQTSRGLSRGFGTSGVAWLGEGVPGGGAECVQRAHSRTKRGIDLVTRITKKSRSAENNEPPKEKPDVRMKMHISRGLSRGFGTGGVARLAEGVPGGGAEGVHRTLGASVFVV